MKRGHFHVGDTTFHAHRYLKSFIYGGLDGIITTFAIVAAVAGASLSSSIVLILGFANLIADGFSMAIGDYLSSKAEREYDKKNKSSKPLRNGGMTFVAFLIFGFIPLLAYVFDISNPFYVSIVLTAIALFALGLFKSRITAEKPLRSGIETLLIGGIAAAIAYGIGAFIAGLV